MHKYGKIFLGNCDGWLAFLFKLGGGFMSTYEALSLMIAFGILIVSVINFGQKNKLPSLSLAR